MATTENVSQVQELVSINLDSQKGFEHAAEGVKDAGLQTLFRDISARRARNAAELNNYVSQSGEKSIDHGSMTGQLHRWWIDAKQIITGGDATSILNEAERGEDSIKQAYEKALAQTSGLAVHDVIDRQYRDVKAGHDRIRELRNQYRNPRG